MSTPTPLSRARGRGSAHEGTAHFWWQRLTGVSNLISLVFFIYTVFALAGAPYAEARSYFATPLASVLTLLLISSVSYHMYLGMQDIVEDYVHASGAKIAAYILNVLFCVLVALASVLAVLRLSLGG